MGRRSSALALSVALAGAFATLTAGRQPRCRTRAGGVVHALSRRGQHLARCPKFPPSPGSPIYSYSGASSFAAEHTKTKRCSRLSISSPMRTSAILAPIRGSSAAPAGGGEREPRSAEAGAKAAAGRRCAASTPTHTRGRRPPRASRASAKIISSRRSRTTRRASDLGACGRDGGRRLSAWRGGDRRFRTLPGAALNLGKPRECSSRVPCPWKTLMRILLRVLGRRDPRDPPRHRCSLDRVDPSAAPASPGGHSPPVRPCQGSGPGSRPAATSASRSR